MEYLLAGLVLFLGIHSTRIWADGWRSQVVARIGLQPWKMLYTALSVAGLVLIVWGWGLARQSPVLLWQPPAGLRHAAALVTLLSFVLLAAAFVPGNQIKARFHHPMVLSVKAWALAHLLANGSLADVLLFGSFLAWSVAQFIVLRRRDRRDGRSYPPGRLGATVLAVLAGGVAWAVFAFWLHAVLIGVKPFGGQ